MSNPTGGADLLSGILTQESERLSESDYRTHITGTGDVRTSLALTAPMTYRIKSVWSWVPSDSVGFVLGTPSSLGFLGVSPSPSVNHLEKFSPVFVVFALGQLIAKLL